MKRSIFLIIFLFSAVCFAQVSKNNLKSHYEKTMAICGGPDSIFSIKGKWKKSGDALSSPDKTFPRTEYKFVNARLDSISVLLKKSIPDLSGMEASLSRGFHGEPYIANGAAPYSMRSAFFRYYCNTNMKKIQLGDETTNWTYVFVNTLNWFFRDADTWDINDDGKQRTIYQLPPKAGKWNGMTVYEPDFFSGGATRVISRAVVIGRNGKIPWLSLTQKQYLTGLKNKYEMQLKVSPKGSGSEREYTNKLKYINDYLAITTEETMQQPAVIDPKAGIWGFKGKFGDEDAGGFRLVLFAASNKYFDTNLPRYVPQLIQLMWKYNPDEPVALSFKNQFEENFPLEKLKAMIDK